MLGGGHVVGVGANGVLGGGVGGKGVLGGGVGGVYLDDASKGLSVREVRASSFAPPSGKFHFLVHHARLNVKAMTQLTYTDSIWVSIMRQPASVFESMFHYYRMDGYYGATFDHLVWKLEGNSDGKKLHKLKIPHDSRYSGRLGRNQMSYDFGIETHESKQSRYWMKQLPYSTKPFT
ncbi:hypothetical protein Pmani_025596 [Petrolisthes manimaculis]|uniref:Sulfotransferase n=1 Tax=Petrolisthes manimaculis TaxID=1843537 RepID=A0AAE1TY96_9EUCA|nr:hypothetical protein Pmani_025596 [Petrolisthes manimaculis]